MSKAKDSPQVVDMYPCTALQEGLMALSTIQPGAYVLQNVFELSPAVDLARLQTAWETTFEAVEILRTRILYMEKALQVVLRDTIKWQKAINLQQYLATDKQIPIEYKKELTRFAIVEEEEGDQKRRYLVWTIHHALYDGWSMSLILSNVQRVYAGQDLIKLVPFSRFINYLGKVDKGKSNNFWQSQFSGLAPQSFLQHAKPIQERVDGKVDFSFGFTKPAGSHVTMSTIVRAAWAVVISKYSDSEDIVFGSTVTGRNAPVSGITTIAGPTITTVPVRIWVKAENGIPEFLRAIQQQATRMIPFEQAGLQNIRRLSADASSACDFQSLLVVQTQAEESTGPLESAIGNRAAGVDTNGFHTYPLVVECIPASNSIVFKIEFNRLVISEVEVERIVHQLEYAIRQLSGDESVRTVGDVKIFSKNDEAQVERWNGKQPTKVDDCVHQQIKQQALVRPEAAAVDAWDGKFTYLELDQLSTRLAQHLIGLGVGPEILVPLCFDKSAWTIIAMVAVLKAGGAFVPLNPSHPIGRLSEIIQDTNAKLIVASSTNSKLCEPLVDMVYVVDPITINELPEAINDATCSKVTGSNPVYAIFTSGTTGRPKGTVIEHASYCSAVLAHRARLQINEETRSLQFASYSFDASLLEILTVLMAGGCVCVPDEQTRMDDIVGYINQANVTWTLLTPSLISTIEPSSVPTLKTLVLGGEAMSQRDLITWANELNLINAYGPSECSVIATMTGILSDKMEAANIGTGVGSLCWITDSNDHHILAPIGCVGELVVEGPLLARRYLNEPEKTAQAFIVNPTWANVGHSENPRRFYKTGDLVRYNNDGSFNFIGRKDSQVKIHGQRLELGEIEYHLLSDTTVENAMVVLPKRGPGRQALVSIVTLRKSGPEPVILPKILLPSGSASNSELDDADRTSNSGSSEVSSTNATSWATDSALMKDSGAPSLSESGLLKSRPTPFIRALATEMAMSEKSRLKSHLSEQLPGYMVPTAWFVVDYIPLDSSGKLDRGLVSRWIEEMDDGTFRTSLEDEKSDQATGPTTATDRKLQAIVSRALNLPLEKVILNRSFQGLGGDSITAMQVVTRARTEGISLRVRDLLVSKSIAELALVAKYSVNSSFSREDEVEREFELSPMQQMYFELSGKPNRFNQSFFLRLTRDDISVQDINKAIGTLVRQHSMLRARFIPGQEGHWRQLISKDVAGSFRFRVYEREDRAGLTPILEDSQSSLNVEDGPVFAADLINIKGDGRFIFLAAHHLVIDLVSWRFVLHDLEEILTKGFLSSTPPFPFQAWLSLQDEYAQKNLTPKKVLSFHVPPADYDYWGMSNKQNVYADTARLGFNLDVDTTKILLGEETQGALRTEPVEVFMATLLYSFYKVFSDRGAPTIYTEGHGRQPWVPEIDISDTVGWFTTISPLHVPMDGEMDIVNVVKRTKDTRRSLSDNGWPYFTARFLNDMAKAEFKGHRAMEILFNYLGLYQQLERDDSLLKPEAVGGDQIASDVGLDVPRMALFDVSVVVTQGVANFALLFNKNMRHQDAIGRWAEAWEASLRDAVATLPQLKSQHTLSDFPLLPLSYQGLEKLENVQLPQLGLNSLEEVEDIYTTSPMQQGLLLSQTRKDKGVYEVEFTYAAISSRLDQPVDANRLLSAWKQVIRRHAMLRTVFAETVATEGLYDQIVLKSFAGTTRMIACENDEEVMDLLKAQSALNHSDSVPRHQMTICTTSSGHIFIRFEINHAIMDAASMGIIMRDLTLAYERKLPAGSGALYSEYVKYIQSRPLHVSIDFWKNYLNEILPCHFPTTQQVSTQELTPLRELKNIKVPLNLAPGVLSKFCSANNVTAANLVQAVWGLVLRAYTGLDDVCFGYLSSGRDVDVDGIDEVVGPLINMLVCRLDVSSTVNMVELVQQVQKNYLECLEHQHVSLAEIQHGLNLNGGRLFNTIMSVQRGATSNTAEGVLDPSLDEEAPAIKFANLGSHDPTEVSALFTRVILVLWMDFELIKFVV